MSRDANGNYSLPPGNPVIPDTVIETSWANPTMADIANALTDSLSRSGKGGMQAPFKNADGGVTTPGITWSNEPTTGFFRKSTGIVGYAVIGVEIFTISAGGVTINPGIFITQPDGAIGNRLVNANDAEAIAIDVLTQGGANYLPLTGGTMTGYTNSPDGAGDDQLINKRDVDALIAAAIAAIPPSASISTGTIIDFAGGAAPAGYLACNGVAVSRVTYAALFNVIGVLWGAGDGVNTFNVPNLSGRATVGSGVNYPGLLGPDIGNVGGNSTHTLTLAEIPSHNHSLNLGTGGVSLSAWQSGYTGNPSAVHATNENGGNGAHNNIQPSAVVFKLIKT